MTRCPAVDPEWGYHVHALRLGVTATATAFSWLNTLKKYRRVTENKTHDCSCVKSVWRAWQNKKSR